MTRLRLSDDAHVEDFDDELVILELRTEQVFALEGSAVLFFRSIVDLGVLDLALEHAARHFDTSAGVIAHDFEEFWRAMVGHHVFVEET